MRKWELTGAKDVPLFLPLPEISTLEKKEWPEAAPRGFNLPPAPAGQGGAPGSRDRWPLEDNENTGFCQPNVAVAAPSARVSAGA